MEQVEGTDRAFTQYDRMQWNIRQLLKEANEAKDKGQWKKAEILLWQLRSITKDNNDLLRPTII